MQDRTTTLEEALGMLQEGNPLGAERHAAEAVKRAEADAGRESMAFAQAQFELGQVLVGVGDLQRAIGALQAAVAIEPASDDERKLHLTMGMNLGELLRHVGELDQAAGVLRRGLSQRADFYGTDHAGYAYGLEPLAEVLLLLGEVPEAAALADDALRIFWSHGNARVAAALSLAAYTRTAMDDGTITLQPEDWLPRFDALPDELREQAVGDVLRRAEFMPVEATLRVLEQLQPHVESALGPTHRWSLQLLAAITNVARRGDDPVRRIAAFEALVDRFERTDDIEQQVQVLQGLALARADAGHTEEANATYRRAIELAIEHELAASASAAARNFGLWLCEHGDRAEGLLLLARAIELARPVGGNGLGRALSAHAIQVQHDGDLATAQVELIEAMDQLDPGDPDTLATRSHLQAIEEGGSCGCGNMGEALSQALREMVLPHVPEGLLADVRYVPGEDGSMQLDVQLARQPTEEELEQLDRVIRQAVAGMQQRSRDAGFSR